MRPTLHELPPLPPHVGALTDEDDKRLAENQPLPSGAEHCPTCRGTGTFRFYDSMSVPLAERKVVQYECPSYDQMVLHRYFLHHGMKEMLARWWWGDAVEIAPEATEEIRAYHSDIERYVAAGLGLYLRGNHGNGKTLMAALLFKTALRAGVDGYWTTLVSMLNNYQETWRDPAHRRWFERRVTNAELLVVDDMGREFEGRTTAASSVDAIFRDRVQGARATIVTTNLPDSGADSFNTRYTRGVTSLVEEACQHIEVAGGDWRSHAQARNVAEITAGINRPFTFGSAK